MGTFLSYDNEAHQSLALMALAASPDARSACEYLKTEHNIIAVPSKLTRMARYRSEQYEELREKIAPVKEKVLTHNLTDNALYASEVTRVTMEQLMERLEEGRVRPQDLAKTARDIADVQAKSIDKKLALEGRPMNITEDRTPTQIINALERLGVMRPVKRVEIEQGEIV
jgi:hypothetical protein